MLYDSNEHGLSHNRFKQTIFIKTIFDPLFLVVLLRAIFCGCFCSNFLKGLGIIVFPIVDLQ